MHARARVKKRKIVEAKVLVTRAEERSKHSIAENTTISAALANEKFFERRPNSLHRLCRIRLGLIEVNEE
jgi:hypothetical protein